MTEAAKNLGEQPAFPCPESIGPSGEICRCDGRGLTIRQQFAMAAMQALLSNPDCTSEYRMHPMQTADKVNLMMQNALKYSDALLEALAARDL